MYPKKVESNELGRPSLEKGKKSIKRSVVLTSGLWHDKIFQSRLAIYGDLSKYVRALIEKDIRG